MLTSATTGDFSRLPCFDCRGVDLIVLGVSSIDDHSIVQAILSFTSARLVFVDTIVLANMTALYGVELRLVNILNDFDELNVELAQLD